jgi:hypothetical protein
MLSCPCWASDSMRRSLAFSKFSGASRTLNEVIHAGLACSSLSNDGGEMVMVMLRVTDANGLLKPIKPLNSLSVRAMSVQRSCSPISFQSRQAVKALMDEISLLVRFSTLTCLRTSRTNSDGKSLMVCDILERCSESSKVRFERGDGSSKDNAEGDKSATTMKVVLRKTKDRDDGRVRDGRVRSQESSKAAQLMRRTQSYKVWWAVNFQSVTCICRTASGTSL